MSNKSMPQAFPLPESDSALLLPHIPQTGVDDLRSISAGGNIEIEIEI
jgi:hypothetical protein